MKILVLAPHTDDAEWGCGASIHKWLKNGAEVFHVAFSDASHSLPEGLAKDTLRSEFHAANDILGVKPENRHIFNYDVRHFPSVRQQILEDLINLRGNIEPDLVLCPSSYDTHQDHEVICKETFRAFKRSSILGWELVWNNRTIELSYFEHVDEENVRVKIDAVGAYESQVFRSPLYASLIRGLSEQRGVQVSLPFAEAFETIRIVSK